MISRRATVARHHRIGFAPRIAHCERCDRDFTFKASQVSAAHRVWMLGSGREGHAAEEFLGGDGTTRRCKCGLEAEVVFTGDRHLEVRWRPCGHSESVA